MTTGRLPNAVERALTSHETERARAALEPLVRRAPESDDAGYLLALGQACEEVGEPRWATTAYNVILRGDPGHPEAHLRLSELAAEAGDLERAAIHREALAASRPEDTKNLLQLLELYSRLGWPEQADRVRERLAKMGMRLRPHASPAEPSVEESRLGAESRRDAVDLALIVHPTDEQVARFLGLFAGREDVHARQWFSPRKGVAGYSPVEEPLTARHVRQHLFGDVTLGVYPIRLDGTCLFFAIDIDLTKSAIEWARRGADEAAEVRSDLARAVSCVVAYCQGIGLPPLLEDSGYKGRHLWFFLEQPERADLLHRFGKVLLQQMESDLPGGVALEFFPRQSRRKGKGYGNLIKVPLGVHRRTGRRGLLLKPDGTPHPRPFDLLGAVTKMTHGDLLGALDQISAPNAEASRADAGAPPWEAERSEPVVRVHAAPPPDWTEADFERHSQVAHLLDRCAVLAELKRRALELRTLEHDEQVVLEHVFGHVPGGVAAFNFLIRSCPGVPESRFLKSPLRGNPVSCPKIRQRIPGVTQHLDCACEFPEDLDHYPTPLLHLRTAPQDPPPARNTDEDELPDPRSLASRYLALEDRRRLLEDDLRSLRLALMEILPKHGGAVELDEGTVSLTTADGVPDLTFAPKG